MVVIIGVVGVIFFSLMHLEATEFKSKLFAAKFSSLYDELYIDRVESIFYPVIFLLKRILIVMCFNIDIMILRCTSVAVLQTIYIIYWYKVKPIKNKTEWKVELVNEVVFTIMIDLLPIFSDMITNKAVSYKLGFIFIVLYVGLFLFNLIVIIVPIMSGIKAFCTKKYALKL